MKLFRVVTERGAVHYFIGKDEKDVRTQHFEYQHLLAVEQGLNCCPPLRFTMEEMENRDLREEDLMDPNVRLHFNYLDLPWKTMHVGEKAAVCVVAAVAFGGAMTLVSLKKMKSLIKP